MCGIFGVINTHPKKIDRAMLGVLGIDNDSRGGDSCGLFIDGQVEYGFDKTKLFSSFMYTSKLLNSVDKATIVLGHCRKASVGGVTLEKAQPVVHLTKDGTIDYVVIHNGTIRNYKELATKYIPDIDITNLSDSQVMMNIFYHKGYDVLGEYDGGSVFVMVDYRKGKPEVRIFQGASLEKWNSPRPISERPFFFIEQSSDTIVFSSIPRFLIPYSGEKKHTHYIVDQNALIRCGKNNELIIEATYDRSKLVMDYYKGYVNPTYQKDTSSIFGTGNELPKTLLTSGAYPSDDDVVSYDDATGLYMNQGEPANGMFALNPLGKITSDFSEPYYFFHGQLLYNEQCYNFLVEYSKKSYVPIKTFVQSNKTLINFLSPYPILDTGYKTNMYFKSSSRYSTAVFSGEILRPFTIYSFRCVNGSIAGVPIFKGFSVALNNFKKIKVPIEVENLYKK